MGKRTVVTVALIVFAVAVLLGYEGRTSAQEYRTISWGASGGDVSEAQAILQQWGYYDGIVDGQFGATTSEAVRWFQRSNGLTDDGVVGPGTWAALGITVAPPPVAALAQAQGGGQANGSSGPTNEHNVDMLARLIRAEAEAEPYEGKVAVAAVMLNRVRDSRFPKTLEGVVYEVDAFESVSNGRIYETPPTDDDYRAARDAVNGWDPTYGCVFFWNPATATSPWVWSRPVLSQIGSHVFAK